MVRAKGGRQARMDDYVRVQSADYYFLKCNNRRKRLSREFSGRGKISLKTANAVAPSEGDETKRARRRELSSHEEGDIKQSRVIMRHLESSRLRGRKSLHAPLHHSTAVVLSCLSMTLPKHEQGWRYSRKFLGVLANISAYLWSGK